MTLLIAGINVVKNRKNLDSMIPEKIVNQTFFGLNNMSSELPEPEPEPKPEPKPEPQNNEPTKIEIIQDVSPSFKSLRSWSHYAHQVTYPNGIPKEKDAVNFMDVNGNGTSYDGYLYNPPNISQWCKNESLWSREDRFPSIEERVKFYMGRWYDEKPDRYLWNDLDNKMKSFDNSMYSGKVFGFPRLNTFDLDPKKMFDAQNDPRIHYNIKQHNFDFINLAIIRAQTNSTTPVLMKNSDTAAQTTEEFNLSYPVFGKVRDLIREMNTNHTRHDPFPGCSISCTVKHSQIIWPLERRRHYTPVAKVPLNDIPFELKISKLVYRGQSGADLRREGVNVLPIEIASADQRFLAVHNYLKSDLVDAKLTDAKLGIPKDHVGKHLSMKELLRYKYLLSIEGNDISSGLKWMLFSNSVVFLAPITYASWAMEPFLKPFVHFIPVNSNMTNLEEMINWAEEHPTETKHIAERSTLFIYDLLFHPDSYLDEEVIMEGIWKRYDKYFGAQK